MFEKIIYSVLYWIGLMIISCVVILMIFKWAYTGPEGEFWDHFGDVPQIVFTAGVVLGLATETLARLERRNRKRREEEES